MSTLNDLQTKVGELIASEDARGLREATKLNDLTNQIATLQATVASLQSQIGQITPEQQAIIDGSIVAIQAVIDKLNAASV